jgi:enoyl-CoA hydratase
MSIFTPSRLPGAEWREIVKKSGTKEFAAAFTPNPVLETSVLNGSCIGVDAIAAFFAATAGGMYDALAFTHETVDGRKTYLEWEGKAFGKDAGGTTILTRGETGLIASVRLYHRPFQIVQQFSAELAKRLKGKVDPGLLSDEVSQKAVGLPVVQPTKFVATQEDSMNADVLTTTVADGIAVVTLGSAKRIYFDAEMGDVLTEALEGLAGDPAVGVVIITGGAPGYFNRHFDIPSLIKIAESLRASGREWPENATYNGGFFDKAMALCESMPKPVIAAISGTALAGAFEFALACDLRVAEDGDYLLGLPEVNLGLLPGAGGTQRLPRTIGTAAALMHILMGVALTPREAERKGFVHVTVDGKAIDYAMELARRLSSFPLDSLAYVKRLVRNATEMPLAQGLALERNLFLKLCVSDAGLARMRSYEERKITSPNRSFEVQGGGDHG